MTWLLLRLVRWWMVRMTPPMPPPVCPDFVEPADEVDEGLECWLDDPDEITNARWYAEHCYGLPAAVKR